MVELPYIINDSEKWNDILQLKKISQLKWQKMMMEYKHYAPEFNPEILTYVDDVEFVNNVTSSSISKNHPLKVLKRNF
jgi:hypothetical protein